MQILQIICYQMLAVYVNNKFFIDLMVDFLVHSLPFPSFHSSPSDGGPKDPAPGRSDGEEWSGRD